MMRTILRNINKSGVTILIVEQNRGLPLDSCTEAALWKSGKLHWKITHRLFSVMSMHVKPIREDKNMTF